MGAINGNIYNEEKSSGWERLSCDKTLLYRMVHAYTELNWKVRRAERSGKIRGQKLYSNESNVYLQSHLCLSH